ncbi:MAG: TonB-dependent receptor [Ignavibacteria bacterium]|nr:TonB-dependent receptor [Ignavibacteria bacterium]
MKLIIFFIGLICSTSALIADDLTDSTAARRTDTVTVTASRSFLTVGEYSVPISTVPQEILANISLRQIDQALIFTPGLTIQNYGGLGGLKTVSMRGGNASQSVVVLDGVVINMAQTGMVDISTIPISLVKNIQVQRGGGSALYGGNAMNGVLNIESGEHDTNVFLGNIGIGSFQEVSAQSAVHYRSSIGNFMVSGDFTTSQGNYPFAFNEFGNNLIQKRENGDFVNSSVALRYRLDNYPFRVTSLSWLRRSDRGVPGAVLQGATEQTAARLTENDIFSSWSFTHNLSKNILTDAGFSLRHNTTRYQDPIALIRGPEGINERYIAQEAHAFSSLSIVSSSLLQQYRVQYSFSDLQGTMIENVERGYVKRAVISGAARYQYNMEILESQWELQTALRGDYYSDVRFSPSGLLSIAWKKYEMLNARSSLSFDFRPPNFNELYYFNFGTRNLKPELSNTYSFGVFGSLGQNLSYEIDGFIANIHDKIIAIPTGPASWSARNVAEVLNRGVELSLKTQFFDKSLLVHYTYSLQNPRDISQGNNSLLPYIPQEIVSLFSLYTFADNSLGMTLHYYSHRFSLGGNQKEALLPAYSIMSLFFTSQLSFIDIFHPQLKVSCDNIFNNQYVVIDNYPMPGRILRFDMSFSL